MSFRYGSTAKPVVLDEYLTLRLLNDTVPFRTLVVFAMVTDAGTLVVYNARVTARPSMRVTAHDREATTVDWHPQKPYVIATGSAWDKTVKGTYRRTLECNQIHEIPSDDSNGLSRSFERERERERCVFLCWTTRRSDIPVCRPLLCLS